MQTVAGVLVRNVERKRRWKEVSLALRRTAVSLVFRSVQGLCWGPTGYASCSEGLEFRHSFGRPNILKCLHGFPQSFQGNVE
jgi:hypothetical protein